MLYRFYHQFPSSFVFTEPALTEEITPAESTEPIAASTKPEHYALQVFGDTHQGRVRENNEDNFYYDAAAGLFMVCDGMGGHAAGEQASTLAVDELKERLQNASSKGALRSVIEEAFSSANERISQAATANPDWEGMGCTGVVALAQENQLHLANIGDSRAYLWRAGELMQLTQDHSVAAELGLSTDELRAHPLRNRLTMALGRERNVNPFCTMIDIQKGDAVLLCSDGLWDMLSDAEIAEILATNLPQQQSVNLLIQAANAAGGDDNITVILGQF